VPSVTDSVGSDTLPERLRISVLVLEGDARHPGDEPQELPRGLEKCSRGAQPGFGSFTQLDALRFALEGLDVPVLYDIDFGHVPPQMALVNGALATVSLAGTAGTLVQSLV
jgi:hypothetical protein